MTCGIYKIENLINHKVYIGQSRKIESRWVKHKSACFNENAHEYNTPLYRAIRKYGLNNFSFEIIDECDIKELNDKEKYWIAKYNSFFNGYNLTLGGDGSGTEIYKEKIMGIFNDLQNTNLIQREIATKWEISEEMVQGINTGRYWKRDDIFYPIRKQYRAEQRYCCDCGVLIFRTAIRCPKCEYLHRTIPVDKMRISREELKHLIRTTPFTTIAANYGVTDNTIRKWCKKMNLPFSAKQIKTISDEDWENI